MSANKTAFTPLRTTLIIFIVIFNILAIVSYLSPVNHSSDMLGLFAVVFIMMCVFVQIMEFAWLYLNKKNEDNLSLKQSYQKAINIYIFLFLLGFVMVYLVLTKTL